MINVAEIEKLDLNAESGQDTLATMIEGSFHNVHSYIQSLSRTWDTNIRFYEGDQWIYYDETLRRNVTIPVIEGKTDFIPRPVTNLIPPALWTIASIFTKNKPSALVFNNSENDNDVMAAKVSEAVLDAKWEIDDEQQAHIEAILIALLCGTVIRKDFWNPQLSPQMIDAPDGSPKVMNLGDTDMEMLSPFEVYPDLFGGQYFLQASVTPLTKIRGMYGFDGVEQMDGYTGRADEVQPSEDYSSVLQIRENLRTLTKQRFGATKYGSATDEAETAVLVECYIKPCERYPKGLMVVEANGIPLYVDQSPYYDSRIEDSWHPYTFFKWMHSPLKWHGISLVEQIVPLQRRINGIDSIIQLHNMSMINPVWMIPKSCQIPDGYINGRPGLRVDYTDSPTGRVPERLPGVPLGQDIYAERQKKIEEFHQIVGDNLVLQGNQPSGVNTASGLQMLLEQSSTKFSPYYTAWEKFIEKGQQKKLLLISKNYTENRPDFVTKLKKLSKKSLNTEIEAFVGADLRDNIQIRIEAGSSIPRSKLVEQQQLMDLANMGLLGDITPNNPVANQEFLQKFGIRQFQGVSNSDLVKANYVISVLRQINEGKLSEQNYPPLLPFEDVDIHMDRLIDEMKKPEFDDPKGVFQEKFRELNIAKEAQINAVAEQGGIPPEYLAQAQQEVQSIPPEQTTPAPGTPQNPGPLPIDQM